MLDPKHLNLEALHYLRVENQSEKAEGRKELSISQIHSDRPAYFGFVPIGKTGLYMYLNGKDDGIALKLLWNHNYERTSTSVWTKLAQSSDIALDIGAHTGIYSLVAAHANSLLKVGAVEPVAQNISRLILNIGYNGLNNITPIPAACTDSPGLVKFDTFKSMGYLTSGASLADKTSGTSICSTTIDDLLKNSCGSEKIIIKIDVEGFEHLALKGAKNVLATGRPIILLECISAETGKICAEMLEKERYSFYLSDDELGRIEPVNSIQPINNADKTPDKKRLNRFLVPSEKQDYFIELVKQSIDLYR